VSGTATTSDTTLIKTATVTCPEGGLAVGGGWTISIGSGGDDEAEISVIRSEATSDTEWTITAEEDSNVSNWSLQAHAVCLAGTA
jgi:hypothetical protein